MPVVVSAASFCFLVQLHLSLATLPASSSFTRRSPYPLLNFVACTAIAFCLGISVFHRISLSVTQAARPLALCLLSGCRHICGIEL